MELPIVNNVAPDLGKAYSYFPGEPEWPRHLRRPMAGARCSGVRDKLPIWLPQPADGSKPNVKWIVHGSGITTYLSWPNGDALQLAYTRGIAPRAGIGVSVPTVFDLFPLPEPEQERSVMEAERRLGCAWYVKGTFPQSDLQRVADTLTLAGPGPGPLIESPTFVDGSVIVGVTSNGIVWKSSDRGLHWEATSSFGNIPLGRTVAVLRSGALLTLDENGQPVRSRDQALTWNNIPAKDLPYGRGGGEFVGKLVSSGDHALALVNYLTPSKHPIVKLGIAASNAEGLGWHLIGAPPAGVGELWATSPTRLWAERFTNCHNDAQVWVSDDDAGTWQQATPPARGAFKFASVAGGDQRILAVGECGNGVFRSGDGGQHWAPFDATYEKQTVKVYDMEMPDDLFAAALVDYRKKSMLLVTTDGGRTWSDVTPTSFDNPFEMACDANPRACIVTSIGLPVIYLWREQSQTL